MILFVLMSTSYASNEYDFIKAAYDGNLSIVQAQLARGTNIDYLYEGGFTALILASQEGHVKVVQALLANGTEINYQKMVLSL